MELSLFLTIAATARCAWFSDEVDTFGLHLGRTFCCFAGCKVGRCLAENRIASGRRRIFNFDWLLERTDIWGENGSGPCVMLRSNFRQLKLDR